METQPMNLSIHSRGRKVNLPQEQSLPGVEEDEVISETDWLKAKEITVSFEMTRSRSPD